MKKQNKASKVIFNENGSEIKIHDDHVMKKWMKMNELESKT